MYSRLHLLTAASLLVAASPAFAHKLIVEHQVMTGQRVRIESWFETGESAVGASVTVQGENSGLLAEGVVDDKGFFHFHFQRVENLRVIVNDGKGHRVERQIQTKDLSEGILRDGVCRAVGSLATPITAAAVRLIDEETPRTEDEPSSGERGGVAVGKLLLGIAIFMVVAAVAAFRSRKR